MHILLQTEVDKLRYRHTNMHTKLLHKYMYPFLVTQNFISFYKTHIYAHTHTSIKTDFTRCLLAHVSAEPAKLC